jgi:hypothetical protein
VSAPVDPIQRRKSQVIAAVFGINLAFGLFAVMMYAPQATVDAVQPLIVDPRGTPLGIGYQIVMLVLCFVWVGLDSQQLEIRRPWWLNVGILLAALIFIPYYLYKTRIAGRRAQAIGMFFGVMLGGIFSMSVGMSLAIALSAHA